MAERERKSKPRAPAPKAEEETKTEGQGLRLAMFGTAAVAIVIGMILLAQFLSNTEGDHTVLLVSFGAFAALWAAMWGVDYMRRRKTA